MPASRILAIECQQVDFADVPNAIFYPRTAGTAHDKHLSSISGRAEQLGIRPCFRGGKEGGGGGRIRRRVWLRRDGRRDPPGPIGEEAGARGGDAATYCLIEGERRPVGRPGSERNRWHHPQRLVPGRRGAEEAMPMPAIGIDPPDLQEIVRLAARAELHECEDLAVRRPRKVTVVICRIEGEF